jgi:hypothetical protein
MTNILNCFIRTYLVGKYQRFLSSTLAGKSLESGSSSCREVIKVLALIDTFDIFNEGPRSRFFRPPAVMPSSTTSAGMSLPVFCDSSASWHRARMSSPSFLRSLSGFSCNSASPATASSLSSGDANFRKLFRNRRISASLKPLTLSRALTRGRPLFRGLSSSDPSSLASDSSSCWCLRDLPSSATPFPKE